MNREAVVAGVRSKAFGVACYSVIIGLALLYIYLNYVRKSVYAELNISCFAFRDTNRNGVYDLEDRPYAGLSIELSRPDGSKVSAESNLSGFTNFPMSIVGSGAMIREPGNYTIEATPPSEWKITSENAVQNVAFKRLEGSPAGIVAEQTFTPVGIAPNLTIAGRIHREFVAAGNPRGDLRLTSPSGDSRAVPIDESGCYSIAVEAGLWRVDYTAPGGKTISRAIQVETYPVVLSTIVPGAAPLNARVVERKVDFDTLTSSDTLYEIPNGYGGLNWMNWVATHQKLYAKAGYVNGAVSAEYVAYNSSGHPAAIWSKRPFDLASAHITAAFPNAEKHPVLIKAWRDSELVYSDRVYVRTAGPIHFVADYGNVTRVEFATETFWQVAIDDVRYRTD